VHPGDRRVLEAHRFAVNLDRKKLDDKIRPRISETEFNRAHGFHPHTKLLAQFTGNSVEVSFARFDLSTWKFPESAVPLMCWAFAKKESALFVYDGCDDSNSQLM
jgi:hypothetical protein